MNEEQSMSPEELLTDLANPADRSTSIKQLAECLMVEFKGPPGLARAIRTAFEENQTGNSGQIRILGDIVKLLLGINTDAVVGGDGDLESLEATHRQLTRQYREGS